MTRPSLWTAALCCALITALSGCRAITPPVAYYSLSSIAGPTAVTDTEGNRGISIGIRTVDLPGYVNRIQMVKRTGPNQMAIAAYHRWADYPDRMVLRLIGENLQTLLADARVYPAPWPAGFKPDVILDVTFHELIGTSEKKVLLSAVWTITGKENLSAAQFHRTTLAETMPGSRYNDLAAAHSRALEALCREVAESLSNYTAP